MKDQRLQIADVVGHIDDATLGNLNVPEFQRRYVWRSSKVAELGDQSRFAEVHEKLQSIKKIDSVPLYEIIVDHELEDVAEIFGRLNTAGTKIRESDIVIALIAAKQQGWIRQKFDPFLKDLELKGFEFDPGVVVRTFAIIGHGSARLRDIPQDFWESSDDFDENWRKTKEAISAVVKNLMEHGVLTSDLLPSLNVLIPVFVLRAYFPKEFDFRKALHWLLLATRDGRYSGSALTVLDSDTKLVKGKASFAEAISELTKPLSAPRTFTADEFQEEYTDKFLRLILYLTIFTSGAKDWINQDVRVGFDREDNELNEGFKPEWHHIFPRKILKDKYEESRVDSIANIAVLNEKANRSFSAKPPPKYLEEHGVKPERLEEQAIPPKDTLVLDKYEDFLKHRAQRLAERATKFMQELAG